MKKRLLKKELKPLKIQRSNHGISEVSRFPKTLQGREVGAATGCGCTAGSLRPGIPGEWREQLSSPGRLGPCLGFVVALPVSRKPVENTASAGCATARLCGTRGFGTVQPLERCWDQQESQLGSGSWKAIAERKTRMGGANVESCQCLLE